MFDFVRKEAKLRLRKTDTCNDTSRPCHSGIYRYPDWTRESGESHTWVGKVIFFPCKTGRDSLHVFLTACQIKRSEIGNV